MIVLVTEHPFNVVLNIPRKENDIAFRGDVPHPGPNYIVSLVSVSENRAESLVYSLYNGVSKGYSWSLKITNVWGLTRPKSETD